MTQPHDIQTRKIIEYIVQHNPTLETLLSIDATTAVVPKETLFDAFAVQDIADPSRYETALYLERTGFAVHREEGYTFTHKMFGIYHGMLTEKAPEAKADSPTVQIFDLYEALSGELPHSFRNSIDTTRMGFSYGQIEAALKKQKITGEKKIGTTIKYLMQQKYLAKDGDFYSPTHNGLAIWHNMKRE